MKHTVTIIAMAAGISAIVIGTSLLIGDQTKEQRAASPNVIVKNAGKVLVLGVAATGIAALLLTKKLNSI